MLKLLALDPGSRRTGYAIFADDTLLEAGTCSPETRDDGMIDRVRIMAVEIEQMIAEERINRVVIEVPSGRIGVGQRRGAGSRLAVYGFAAGAIWAAAATACGGLLGHAVIAVDERQWTARVPKSVRQRRIAAEYPAYADVIRSDGGGDIADAIGLGAWWLARQHAVTASGV